MSAAILFDTIIRPVAHSSKKNYRMTINIQTGVHGIAGFTVIRVGGADAVDFLHRQLTQQINGLKNRSTLAGYCSPQGRLIATFRAWEHDSSIYLLVASDLVEAFIKRIKMFVLRSKVEFEILDRPLALELSNEEREDESAVEAVGGELFVGIGSVEVEGRLIHRRIIVGRSAEPSNAFQASELFAGVPWISAATTLMFTPQAVNFELAEGVSFRKGCYPGQEVVSRIQHIGETPRRGFIFRASAGSSAKPAADVYDDSAAAGSVVNAVNIDGALYCFASAKTSSISSARIFTESSGVGEVEMLALPYEYKNVLKIK